VCVTLTVVVNEDAMTGGSLYNLAQLWGTIWVPDPNDPNMILEEDRVLASAERYTKVCCWQEMPDVLYVDKNATSGADQWSGLAECL